MLEEMYRLNKNSPLPLYYQLKEFLIKMIKEDKLKPGDKIPSERDLCDYHEVSRMTVHKAIEQLVQEKYLYREKGRGTFVAAKKDTRIFSPLYSFSAEMKAQGLAADTFMKSWQVVEADQGLAHKLKLKLGERLYRIERLRLVDELPFLLETTHIPVKLCPDLSEEILRDHSLYKIFRERYHYRLKRAEATVEPILLTGATAEELKASVGTMGLFFCQLTLLEEERPIEYTQAYYRSDDYKFRLKFSYEDGTAL